MSLRWWQRVVVGLVVGVVGARASAQTEDAGADDAALDASLDAAVDAAVDADREDAVMDASARTDAGPVCLGDNVTVDREGHCCLAGQAWREGRCQGSPTSCAPGQTQSRDGLRCEARSHDGERNDAGVVYGARDAGVVARAGEVAFAPSVFRVGSRSLSLGSFALDRTEVSVAAYARCVAAGVCEGVIDPLGQMSGARNATRPVVNVTYAMATRYCQWAGGRLPTDAEWTFAARGVEGRRYPWGHVAPRAELAVFPGVDGAPTAVTGQPLGASPQGVLNLLGNVAEWVADRPGASRPSASPGAVERDPTGGATGNERIVRGGSFRLPAEVLSRELVHAMEARSDLGFRCARGL